MNLIGTGSNDKTSIEILVKKSGRRHEKMEEKEKIKEAIKMVEELFPNSNSFSKRYVLNVLSSILQKEQELLKSQAKQIFDDIWNYMRIHSKENEKWFLHEEEYLKLKKKWCKE